MSSLKEKEPLRTFLCFATVAMLLTASSVWADSGAVVAQSRNVETSLRAFARVEPMALVRLKAQHAGIVAGLGILPGETVKAGTVIGHLQGAAVEAELARRRSAIAGARGALAAARKILVLEQEKQAAQLSTLKEVYQAEASLVQAQTRLDDVHSQMRALQEALALRAPASGTVLSVEAAAGEQVEPGQTLLTLQPKGGLWLMATFFGSDGEAVRVGQRGSFAPAGAGGDIPVRVRAIIGTVEPGGGQPVGLVATIPAPRWRSGATGTVTLKGPQRTFVAVPTRALILDQGTWWLLVRTPKGIRRQAVVPGPSRGESTLIEQGLQPGAEIVVDNAYLMFHRDFSKSFQAPD